MKIAIADDSCVFAQRTEQIVKKYFEARKIPVEIRVLSDGQYLLADIEERKNYDIYLLDIEMPNTNGLQVAERIRRWDKKAQIVFITSHEKYAMRGYQYQVCRYIMKERCAEQLPGVLDYILDSEQEDGEEYYCIVNEQKYERFPVKDILYMKKEGKNTVFCCRGGANYRERSTLEKVYKQLDQNEFMYVNRGEIVSLRHVTGLKDGKIELYDIVLPISRYQIAEVKQKLLRYWGKER